MANLISAEAITKSYGKGNVLDGVSLGIAASERIGVVGINGGGKSTLLKILAGVEMPDSGRYTQNNQLRLGHLAQIDAVDPLQSVREVLFGQQAAHDWATNPLAREVVMGLFGSLQPEILTKQLGQLSGGERRRVGLARLLISDLNLILLDEPTNHLDIQGISWLANHLKSRKNLAVVVITHDRWFLDEVADRVWEVVSGKVEEYDGGYSAYVLAKAERLRQAAAEDARRNNLIRKELAWLRRGAPARTSKPKFRVDAANQLISKEPPPRNNVELLNFAVNRLGKRVFELTDVSYSIDESKSILKGVTVNFGPGIRYGILGANGTGKTSLLKLLTSSVKPTSGKLVTGATVKLGYLSQHLDELDPSWRVLEAVQHVATYVDLGNGKELSASQLCERLGFSAASQWTPVGDLSGGEKRRLQLTRMLMSGPNVILLDEPTNDFDVETLASLEDLLDSFAGTLIVVSHDRYFIERVCDQLYFLTESGELRHLPGGIDQYLAQLSKSEVATPQPVLPKSSVNTWQLQKDLARVERKINQLTEQITQIQLKMVSATNDYLKLQELQQELDQKEESKIEQEESWLNIQLQLDGED